MGSETSPLSTRPVQGSQTAVWGVSGWARPLCSVPAPILGSQIKGAAGPASSGSSPLRRVHSGVSFVFVSSQCCKNSVGHLTGTPGSTWSWEACPCQRLVRPTPWPLGRAILSPLPRLLPPLPSVLSPRLISTVGPYPSDPTVSSVLVSQWPLSTGIPGLVSQVV